jgi:hypothetical protein
MRNHPFSDDDTVAAVLRGEVPAERPDLAPLAGVVAEMRAESSGTPPQPNAALAALLDHGLVAQGLSAEKSDLPVTAASNAPGPAMQAFRLPTWRKRMIVEWIAGLGLAAKIGMGATVAAASVAGAGAGGVLPGQTQNAFDTVVATATPWETEAEAAEKAADEARDAEEQAREQAEEAEEQAREQAEVAEEQARDAAEHADDQARDDADNADDAADDAKDAEEEAREQAEDADDQARDDADDAADQARDDADQARDDADDAADQARDDADDADQARDDAADADDDQSDDSSNS